MKKFKKHLDERCWKGYKPVKGKKAYSPGSCEKIKEADCCDDCGTDACTCDVNEQKYHYSVYKVGIDGKLSNRENLNHDELDDYMNGKAKKFNNIKVVRSDGKAVFYTRMGKNDSWVVQKKVNEGEDKESKKLNDPIRTPGGPKKFKVYVKDPKTGNIKTVRFGDPDMEIKRDDPERRKSFRARHNCSDKKDKTTPGYWSCYQWRKGSKVNDSYEDPVDEKLKKSDPPGKWVKDFRKSKAPQFKGKTKEKKRQMAIAAYLSKKNESLNEMARSRSFSGADWIDNLDSIIKERIKNFEETVYDKVRNSESKRLTRILKKRSSQKYLSVDATTNIMNVDSNSSSEDIGFGDNMPPGWTILDPSGKRWKGKLVEAEFVGHPTYIGDTIISLRFSNGEVYFVGRSSIFG